MLYELLRGHFHTQTIESPIVDGKINCGGSTTVGVIPMTIKTIRTPIGIRKNKTTI